MKPAMGPMMVHLTSVGGSFRAKVITARLGTEGVLAATRGCVDVYPIFGEVDIFVHRDQLELAREILLADAVDDAFGDVEGNTWTDDDPDLAAESCARSRAALRRRLAMMALLVVVALVLVGYVAAAGG